MRCPTLSELPPPPEGKTGWPWTEETPPLPDRMPDGRLWPKVSIVTPSYNQGQFLEETIRSVLLQGYPDLEYIIIDGGSTDNSVEIIKKYEPWLAYWVSEEDRGQSHAINKGWSKCNGDIIAYLNSDDIYFPNCFQNVAVEIRKSSESYSILFGSVASCNDKSLIINELRPVLPYKSPLDLTLVDPLSWHLAQPSAFFTKKVLDHIGFWVREDLHYTMDRELIYRAVKKSKVIIIDKVLATYRFHQEAKTTSRLLDSYLESVKAFSYCDWGTESEKKVRHRMLKKRLAIGYYAVGGENKGLKALKYFIKSILLDLNNIRRITFIKKMIKRIFYITS